MHVSSHKKNDIKTRSVLRIPDDKVCKPHTECTNKAEKVSPSKKLTEGRCILGTGSG